MSDVARFLKGAGDRRQTKVVYMSPDPDAITAADVAEAARSGGSLADAPPDLLEARREALDSAWKFTVSQVPTAQWENLISQHPATDEQITEARRMRQNVGFNPETFPQAAAAACLVKAENPDGDVLSFDPPKWGANGALVVDPVAVELMDSAWDTFPMGETTRLWTTVMGLNVSMEAVNKMESFANDSATTRSGGR